MGCRAKAAPSFLNRKRHKSRRLKNGRALRAEGTSCAKEKALQSPGWHHWHEQRAPPPGHQQAHHHQNITRPPRRGDPITKKLVHGGYLHRYSGGGPIHGSTAGQGAGHRGNSAQGGAGEEALGREALRAAGSQAAVTWSSTEPEGWAKEALHRPWMFFHGMGREGVSSWRWGPAHLEAGSGLVQAVGEGEESGSEALGFAKDP